MTSTNTERSPHMQAIILIQPLKKIKSALTRIGKETDLIQDFNMANHWMLVVSLYFGLEMALKVLAWHYVKTSPEGKAKGREKMFHDWGHNLSEIWKHIDEKDRKIIRKHWGEFISLHEYLKKDNRLCTVEGFLNYLTGDKSKGGILWRYSLIAVYNDVPKVSVEGMIQIWESIGRVYLARVVRKEDEVDLAGPLWRISRSLLEAWNSGLDTSAIQIQDRDRERKYDCDQHQRDISTWITNHSGFINASEDILWKSSRGLHLGDGGESEETLITLKECAKAIANQVDNTDDPNLRLWASLARQQGIQISLTDPPQCDIGYRLEEKRLIDNAPEGSHLIEIDSYAKSPERILDDLRHQHGYEVKEYKVDAKWGQKGYWLLYSGHKNTDAGESVVRVWRSWEKGAGWIAIENLIPKELPEYRSVEFWVELDTDKTKGVVLPSTSSKTT